MYGHIHEHKKETGYQERKRMVKSYRKELWFCIPQRRAIVNITQQVEEALRESGIQEGLLLVNAMNITASVLLMMMNRGCTTTMKYGWKNWPPKSRIANTSTMDMKITRTPT